MVQLLTFCTDPKCYNGQCYRRTDRQHSPVMMPILLLQLPCSKMIAVVKLFNKEMHCALLC